MTRDSELVNYLEIGIRKQETSDEQFYILKTVLNNYPRYTELGEAALDVCHKLSDRDLEFWNVTDDKASLSDTLKFALLELEYAEPEELEEPEEGDNDYYNPPDEVEWPIYNAGREDVVAGFLEFCAYGVSCKEALKYVGLKYDPFTPGMH